MPKNTLHQKLEKILAEVESQSSLDYDKVNEFKPRFIVEQLTKLLQLIEPPLDPTLMKLIAKSANYLSKAFERGDNFFAPWACGIINVKHVQLKSNRIRPNYSIATQFIALARFANRANLFQEYGRMGKMCYLPSLELPDHPANLIEFAMNAEEKLEQAKATRWDFDNKIDRCEQAECKLTPIFVQAEANWLTDALSFGKDSGVFLESLYRLGHLLVKRKMDGKQYEITRWLGLYLIGEAIELGYTGNKVKKIETQTATLELIIDTDDETGKIQSTVNIKPKPTPEAIYRATEAAKIIKSRLYELHVWLHTEMEANALKECERITQLIKQYDECPSDDESPDELEKFKVPKEIKKLPQVARDSISLEKRKIGAGQFSEIYPGTAKLANGGSLSIVLKRIVEDTVYNNVESPLESLGTEATISESIRSNTPSSCLGTPLGFVCSRNKANHHVSFSLLLKRASCNLTEFLASHRLSEMQMIILSLDIAHGLDTLHRNGYLHCDLKDSNVLVDKQSGVYRAKIADFGVSKKAATSTDHATVHFKQRDGTIMWQEPMVMRGSAHTAASDIFSLCLIMAKIGCNGANFLQINGCIEAYIKKCKNKVDYRPEISDICNPRLYSIITQFWGCLYEPYLDEEDEVQYRRNGRTAPSLSQMITALKQLAPEYTQQETTSYDFKLVRQ